MSLDLLSQLRDIHHPPPIPFWPPAIGWDFLSALIIGFLSVYGYQRIKSFKRRRLKKIILTRLTLLQSEKNNGVASRELSMLLRRAALAVYPRSEVAGLVGDAWLSWLDNTAMTNQFQHGPGRLLIVSPYQGTAAPLPESLFELIQVWVKKNL